MNKVILSICVLMIYSFAAAQDYRFGKVSGQEINQKEHPDDPSAEAAILYREIKTEFDYSQTKGWFLVTDYFERIKIYNKDGADYANRTVDLYLGKQESDELKKLRAFTYNMGSNGKIDKIKLESNGIIKEEVNDFLAQTKITMPDVQEGSVIEIRYTIESPFVMNIDEYQFQELIPVDQLHFSFSTPEYYRFQTYHRGWIPFDVKTTTSEKSVTVMVTKTDGDSNTLGFARKSYSPQKVTLENTIYTIDMSAIPAIEEEPYVGNIRNYMSGIQFELSSVDTGSGIQGYSVTWDDVAKRIYQSDAFGSELQRNNYFKKDLDPLLKGVSDPLKKTGLIYDYMQQKMNWNGYSGVFTHDGVRKAYKENSGNVAEINLMMAAMLNYANVKAYPVLVSTKSHGIPLFPTLNGFNYVIVAAEIQGNLLLMDATSKNAEIGVLGSHVMNGNGRIVNTDLSSDWIALTSVIPSVNQTLLNVSIGPDLEISGQAQRRVSGNFALSYRNGFKNVDETQQKKNLENSYEGVDLSGISFENLEEISNPVILKYDFETDHGIEEVGGKIFVSPLFFLQTKENPFKSEDRKYPVDFGYVYRNQTMISFVVPDGYEIESLPENNMSTLGDMGSYKYLVSQSGRAVQLSVDFSINRAVIAESDYADLKSFFEFMVEKEAEKIVLKKV